MTIVTRGVRGSGGAWARRAALAPTLAVAGLLVLAPAAAAAPDDSEGCSATGSAISGIGSSVTSPVSSVTFGSECSGSAVGLDLGSLVSWFVGS